MKTILNTKQYDVDSSYGGATELTLTLMNVDSLDTLIDDERERRKGGREEGLEGRKEGRWRGRREEEKRENRV